jgi:outer membrane protein assembly factor BamA
VWRSDNLFGRNQQSKLTVAYKSFQDADEDDETQIRWNYFYPRIINTPYSLSVTIAQNDTNLDETIDGETGRYERQRRFFRVQGGMWLNREGPSQGLTIRTGPVIDDYEHTFVSGTDGLLPDVTVMGITVGLNGYYVDDLLLSRSGHHYGVETTLADDVFGSEINFIQHFVFYRKYIPLEMAENANLNYQLRAGYISQSILGPPQFEIGGSSSLRGYDRETVEGNSFMILNVEWLYPVFNRETLRSAVIFDMGNAWTRDSEINPFDLKYSLGVGLRWKLQRFVRTDIRIDIAHGLSDDGETKAYLGTRLTF